ncbi:hypothetical protein LSUE1_G003386 [Lachnellula suecica]|uniref:DUF7580 domain-containing protein n=1 Tax=Lachnellula suecica TaxID=602035 RepID=A0A8T9CI39_9HELO|nr:hypothetical protein LSUE1_G003386 [Lachnellula suecica]
MATGIETAGLVLAVLPLFISALEHYKEGLDPIKIILDYDNQLPMNIHRLSCQHMQYELTLRILLSDIAEGDELAAMITSPFGRYWKGAAIQLRLRTRLRESYGAYERTVQRMEELLKDLAKKLSIDHARTADLESLLANNPQREGKFEFSKRVKFSMSRKRMKSILDELDDYNKQLEGFTTKTSQLDSFESSVKSTLSLPFNDQIRSYAKNLYKVICLGIDCQYSHKAKLKLEQRSKAQKFGSRPHAAKQARRSEISFTLSFQISSAVRASSEPTIVWQDTRIRAITAEDIFPTSIPLPGHRSARFALDIPMLDLPAPTIDLHSLPELNDICTIIRQPQETPAPSCLGFCLDHLGKLRGMYPLPTSTRSQKDTISLAEILSSSSLQLALSLKDRLMLGTTLASSYLQLHATPWLRSNWSKEDIIFDADRESTNLRCFNPESPCITHTFQSEPQQPTPGDDQMQGVEYSTTGDTLRTRGNTSLLALGIILMELYTGQTLEQHCEAASLGSSSHDDEHLSSIHNLYVAHQWLEELKEKGRLSHAYAGAAHRCIQGYLDFAIGDDEAGFRQKVLDYVVLPVEQEMRIFVGVGR